MNPTKQLAQKLVGLVVMTIAMGIGVGIGSQFGGEATGCLVGGVVGLPLSFFVLFRLDGKFSAAFPDPNDATYEKLVEQWDEEDELLAFEQERVFSDLDQEVPTKEVVQEQTEW